MSDKDNDGAGYGKPPKGSQFKKGKSGNPGGRPKGHKNFKTDLEEELRERIPISENGRKRKITKQRGFLKRLLNDALSGKAAASRIMIGIIAKNLLADADEAIKDGLLSAEDEALLKRYLGEV